MGNNNNIKVSQEQKNKIKNNSPDKIPLNPSNMGFSGQQIRKMFSKAISSNEGSLLSLLEEKMDLLKTKFDEVDNDSVLKQEEIVELKGKTIEHEEEITNILGRIPAKQNVFTYETVDELPLEGQENVLYFVRKINIALEGEPFDYQPYNMMFAWDFEEQSFVPVAGGGAGGGGGGGGLLEILRLRPSPIDAPLSFSHGLGTPLTVNFTYAASIQEGVVFTYLRGSEILFSTSNNTPGEYTFDIGSYVQVGSNVFSVKATTPAGTETQINFVVQGIELVVTSQFIDTNIYETLPIVFPFRFSTNASGGSRFGEFSLDGGAWQEISVTSLNNAFIIEGLTHGVHYLDFRGRIEMPSGNTLYSPMQRFTIFFKESGNNQILLGSYFNQTSSREGDLVAVDYLVYNPQSLNQLVEFFINDEKVGETIAPINRRFWNLRNLVEGEQTLKIVAGDQELEFVIDVEKLDIDVQNTDDFFLKTFLTASGRSNVDANRNTWLNSGINGQSYPFIMGGFNFETNGWINDGLVFNGLTNATLEYKPFEQEVGHMGMTIEIEFKAEELVNTEEVLIDCMANNRGISISPTRAILRGSNARVDVFYREKSKIKISFVIDKLAQRIFTYINGVKSGLDMITSETLFSQGASSKFININEVNGGITLYNLRIYDRALNDREILGNYIFDEVDTVTKVSMFNGTQIYDEFGNIDVDKIKTQIPIFIIELNREMPSTSADRPFTNVVEYYNPFNPNLNFTRNNVRMRTQGTSTLQYPVKNWRLYNINEPVTIDPSSRPAYILNLKSDYMESSMSTDPGLAKFIEDMYDGKLPPQETIPGIRTTIYGSPCVLFHRRDGQMIFYGVYNFNNDKSEPAIYGHDPSFGFPESRRFELGYNRTNHPAAFVRPEGMSQEEYEEEVKDAFEPIYPKDDYSDTNYAPIIEFIDFISNADVESMSPQDLEDFKEEWWKRLDQEFTIKYLLTIFVFGLVDNFGKDLMFNTWGEEEGFYKWYFTFYDMDTAFGIDNQGRMVREDGTLMYDYDIELEDQGAYAQADSKLWELMISLFSSEIRDAYASLRNTIFRYDNIMYYIYTEQIQRISKTLYNENAIFKYVMFPGSEPWLFMLNGDRYEQIQRWLTLRLAFLDSKYLAGVDGADNIISLRLTNPNASSVSFDITPTIAQWVSMVWDGTLQQNPDRVTQERASAGQQVTLHSPISGGFTFNNMTIFAAQYIQDLGDLTTQGIDTIQLSGARRLRRLILGSETDNTQLNDLVITNAPLLEELDIRNLKGLTNAIEAQGLIGLAKIDARGSNIQGVSLPEGGVLREYRLPSTINFLTLLNQSYLDDESFEIEGTSNLTFLRIEGTPGVNSLQLLVDASNLENVRITGVQATAFGVSRLIEIAENIYDFVNEEFLVSGLTFGSSPEIEGNVMVLVLEEPLQADIDKINTAFQYMTLEYYYVNPDFEFEEVE